MFYLKKISPLLKRVYKAYASRQHQLTYKGLQITVLPSVFHPQIFLSTQIFAHFLDKQSLKDLKILELGAGSGTLSLLCARQGGFVTASDINPAAVDNVRLNATQNNLTITAIQSDLFNDLSGQQFDRILINPPYYPKDPAQDSEYAFYCGADFGYFKRLFSTVAQHLEDRQQSKVWIILSEDCALERIALIARSNGWWMRLVWEEIVLGEKNYIFELG